MAVIDVWKTGLGLPGLAIVLSAGSLVSAVLIVTACICCRKPKTTKQKASVRRNVVAEEEVKTNSLGHRTSINKKEKGRPPPTIFEGTTIGSGGWDDLTNISENDIPVKFRQKIPRPAEPSNPPDVILHPSMIHVLRSESKPQSKILLRAPSSPSSSRGPRQPTSVDELREKEKPEIPLSKYSISRGRKEKNKDGSILYYHPKIIPAKAKRIGNLAQSQRVSRDRIRSSEEPLTIPASERKTRQVTPSDPDDLRGLPHYDRSSGGWDNVPKPEQDDVKTPPPLPSRGYLDHEVEMNTGVSQSDWSEDIPRPQNKDVAAEQVPKVKDVHKPLKKRSRSHENARSRSLESHLQHSSPKRKASDKNYVIASFDAERQHRSHPSHAQREDSDLVPNSMDNLAYSRDGSPSRRNIRHVPLHQDVQRHRQRNGDFRERPALSERHVVLEDHQRRHQQRHQHRRVNDLIQENIPLPSYDPSRVHLVPGVYLRPKPYYPYTGLQDPTKRYSDASDYSDFVYDRNPYYANRVNRDFRDPYFFRSRWSTTPDSLPEDIFRRRHNSDFVLDEHHGLPRDQQPIRQPHRKSRIAEETYDSDVIRDQPGNAGRVSRSSGYQSLSSRNEESPSELNLRIRGRLLPNTPRTSVPLPRVRTGIYYPRLAQPPTHSLIQDIALSDVPFHSPYHSQERNGREEGPFLQGVRLRRYQSPTSPRDVAPERYRPSQGVLIEEHDHSAPTRNCYEPPTPPRDVHYRSPAKSLGASNENQNRWPQDVSPEHCISPRKSQKRRREQQPGHSKPTQQPQEDTKEQHPNVNDRNHNLRSPSRDVATEHPYSAQALSNDLSPLSSQSSLSKRPSTEYGSLIDIMYSYRQTVRESRQKENPTESPESRLRCERETLKSKLTKELEPRHRQTRNLDMVIDTLLYLCERDNNTVNKRSWQRDYPDRPKSKSRPNSEILLPPADDDQILQIYSSNSDVTKERGDYASIQVESSNSQRNEPTDDEKQQPIISVENTDPKIPETSAPYPKVTGPLPKPKRRCRYDYCEVPLSSPPPKTQETEFAFPSEEMVNEILKQHVTAPPIPPRRNRGTMVAPPHENPTHVVSPSKNVNSEPPKIPRRVASARKIDSSSPRIPPRVRLVSTLHEAESTPPKIPPRISSIKTTDLTLYEPPYAKIKKRKKTQRMRSLPSVHLTESEIHWLQQSSGKLDDVTKRKYSKFEKGARHREFKSTRNPKGSTQYDRVSPVVKLTENAIKEKKEENTFAFDDIPIGEDADAEDIITAIEQRMSETKSPENSPSKHSKQNSPYHVKPSFLSDSDMGTWSSVASSDLAPAPPRRRRFNRSEGKFPRSSEHTPLSSPTCMQLKHRFHTPPPDGNWSTNVPLSYNFKRTGGTPSGSPVYTKQKNRFHTPSSDETGGKNAPSSPNSTCTGGKITQPISIPRKESISPVGKSPVFQTPPESPHVPSPLITARRSSSVANIPTTVSSSPSGTPRILPQPSGPQFTPRKQQDSSKRRISRFMSHRASSSAPGTPTVGPKTPLKRAPSKFAPRIPFVGKKFVQQAVQTDIVPIESDKRRISRKGEIVILPEDHVYADPIDCVRKNSPSVRSPNRDIQNTTPRRASSYTPLSPMVVLPHSQDSAFYPIREDGDDYAYAVPINSPPNLLLRQRILSRSNENILNDFETAV